MFNILNAKCDDVLQLTICRCSTIIVKYINIINNQ